ncbi:MAG: hypothetical protein ACI83W_002540, partial [Marinoscillum sp.]
MKYLSILVLALLCMCCSTPKPQVEIADLFDRYYEESLLFNPINATYAGDNRY